MILHAVAAGTDTAGPAAVLLHGLFGQSGNFATVQKHLARRRRGIAIDLRNHGASPHAPTMSYPDMARDVLETLAAAQALPCALVGHSMGGKVAMAAALQDPGAVARLAVADIAPVAYAHRNLDYVRAMQAVELRPGITRAQADAALAETIASPGLRGFLLLNFRPGEAPGWKLALDAIAGSMPDIEGWPDGLHGSYAGPTLFISGARSDYVLPEHRPAIRALFPAARFVTLKDAGHWLHADNPDGFMALLDAFLG